MSLPDDRRAGNVGDAFRLMCRWNARYELIVDGETRYTGQRLSDEAEAVARALTNSGAGAGKTVLFIGHNSARFVAAFVGAHIAGAVTCNIHPAETPAFVKTTFDQLNPSAIICDEAQLDKVAAVLAESNGAVAVLSLGTGPSIQADLCFDEIIAGSNAGEGDVISGVGPDDPAIVILSSGSTGPPKGICHNQANFVEWMRHAPALFGHAERGTRFLVIVGTSFAAWVFSGIPVLHAGGAIILMKEFSPEAFCALVEKERVTMVGPVPTMIRMLDPSITDRYDLSSFRMVLCAGEPPSSADIERIRGWAATDIRCLYLASETSPGAATFWQLRDMVELGKPVCAGRPVPGADIRIVDPDGTIDDLLPPGHPGEILLSGPTIAQGYWNNPELTQARFRKGWWRSGDIGQIDEDGFLYVHGRNDNTINSGGIKVQGEEVELCLLRHPAVRQAAVIGVPDAKWGHRIEAHVTLSAAVDVDDLFHHCRTELAAFKVPKEIRVRDNLPTGVTGKLDRVALRKERM